MKLWLQGFTRALVRLQSSLAPTFSRGFALINKEKQCEHENTSSIGGAHGRNDNAKTIRFFGTCFWDIAHYLDSLLRSEIHDVVNTLRQVGQVQIVYGDHGNVFENQFLDLLKVLELDGEKFVFVSSKPFTEQAHVLTIRRMTSVLMEEVTINTPIDEEGVDPLNIEAMEKRLIQRAIAETNGDLKKASERLGMSLKTLTYRAQEYKRQVRR